MNSKTELLLKVMRFLAWIVFVAMLIKAGAIIMSFGVSINNSEAAKDLYRGMDLSRYEIYSFIHYAAIVCYHILQYLLFAYGALFITKLLSANNLKKPFNTSVLGLLKKMQYTIFSVLIMSVLHNVHVAILEKYAAIAPDYFTNESIFLAGMVLVLVILFRKNLEIQLTSDQF